MIMINDHAITRALTDGAMRGRRAEAIYEIGPAINFIAMADIDAARALTIEAPFLRGVIPAWAF